MRKKSRSSKRNMTTFDSLTEFLAYVALDQPLNPQSTEQSSVNGTPEFTGTSSYSEALELLRTGWLPKAEELNKKLKAPTIQHTKPRPEYNVVGHQASVPRYLQGIPTNMVHHKQVPVKQKIVNVYRDISFSAMWTTDRITDEGVKALQIVQALENKGYRVNLYVSISATYGNESESFSILIKKSSEALSLARVAFPLVHPSMLRRFSFRFLERQPLDSSWYYGYGRPDPDEIKKFLTAKDVFLPANIGKIDDYIKNF